MIDLSQWRASIGLHNAASSRSLARIPGKSRLAGLTQQLAERWAIMLASLLRERFGRYQLLIDMVCYTLLIGVLMCAAEFNYKLRQTGISDVLHGGWFLSVSLLQVLPGDVERSLSALAILLIMAGDVEQNPGPGRHGTYVCMHPIASPLLFSWLSIAPVAPTIALYKTALTYGHILTKKIVCLISGAAGCGKKGVKYLICGKEPLQHHEIADLVEGIFRPMSVVCMDIEEDKWLDLEETKLSTFLDEARIGLDSGDGRSVSPLPPHSTEETKYIMKNMTPSANSSKELFCINQIYIIDSGGQSAFHELYSLFFNNIDVLISVVDLSLRLSERPIDKHARPRDGDMLAAATKSALTQEVILQDNFRTFQAQLRSIEPTRDRRKVSVTKIGSVKELISGNEDGVELPLLIIVGTQKDLEHEKETIREKNKRVRGLVKEFESHLITYGRLIKDEVIFPVNAKDPTQSDKDTINSVKQKIVTVTKSLPMEVMPIKWYVLEILLHQKSKAILSFKQCLREAAELGMKENELYAALDYLKDQNSLFFYDCLPNIIFCSLQPLLDTLTELVERSFKLREANALTNIDRNLLMGLVTQDFFAGDCLDKYHVREGDVTFTPKEFIKLMAYKHVIAQVSDKVFFMPMILPKLEATIPQKLYSEHIAPLAIRFPGGVAPTGVFCCLVASLLSPASPSSKQWTLAQGESFRNCIKFQHFFQDLLRVSLTLIDSFTHFEAHVDIIDIPDYDKTTTLCRTVKEDIQKHLEIVCKHRGLLHEFGILCMTEASQDSASDSVVEPHFAVLKSTGKKIVYYCEGVNCKERLVTEREKCWELPYKVLEFPAKITVQPTCFLGASCGGQASFKVTATGDNLNFIWQKGSSTSIDFTDVDKRCTTVCYIAPSMSDTDESFRAKLEEKPGLTDLESFHGVHIIERIEESIGVDLLHDQYGNIMKEIVGNTRGQASRIKYAILQRWVTKGVDRSWRRLIEVLKKKDCNALVQDVQEKLRAEVAEAMHTNTFTPCMKKAVLTISNIVKTDEGMYRCVVSNAAGPVTSDTVELTVLTVSVHPGNQLTGLLKANKCWFLLVIALFGLVLSILFISTQLIWLTLPTISIQPSNKSMVTPGNFAIFSVSVEAVPRHNETYQWQKNETDIPGAISNAHIIFSVSKADEGTYRCVVSNTAGSVTSDSAWLTMLTPPKIILHPNNQPMVVPGNSVTFTVSVEAIPGHNHTFQWKKNESDIPNATSGTLTIFSVTKADEGMYCCVVSNAAGLMTSEPAELTLLTPPTITVQPTDQSMVIPGSLSTFTVTVKTIPGHEHTYQWQKNKTNISESTSSTLTISDVTRSDEATYCCIVSNAAGSVTSDPAEITVLALPTIKTQPTNRSKVVPGSSTTFTVSVKAIPGHDHTYQWQKNKTNIVGATSISLTISSVAKSDEGIYHCVVSNAAGPVMSDPAWLTVLTPPTITAQIKHQLMVVPGNTITFTISVESIPGHEHTYQWQKNENDIPGATSGSLTILNVAMAHESLYCCVVSNAAGIVTSDSAWLTVLTPPTITAQINQQLMVVPGYSVTFTISVETIPGHEHTYQWQKNENDILGATSGSLTILSVGMADESLYCCIVSNAAGTVTSDSAWLTVLTPPTIIVQPTDQSMVVPGSSSTFTVSVKVIPGHDHTYQWQKNKTNISEATSSTLTISGVTKSDDEAIYSCLVSNAAGLVTSDPAQLTVLIPPTIIVQPIDQSVVVPGSSFTFTVAVEAIPGHDHTYQWQKNKTNISEATSDTLTISSVTKADDEAIYCCIVSNAAGPVTSDPAELTVLTPPTITVQPTDRFMVIPGSSSTFTVSVRAVPGHDHTYQWQKNETNISEATSGTLTISGVTKADDEAIYNCIVSNAAGAVTSDSAKLTVLTPPIIMVHPTNKSMVVPGSLITFTASLKVIVGHDPIYQWQKNGTDIPGAKSSTHVISSVDKSDEGIYYCVVSNAAGTVISDHAGLTVLTPPILMVHPINQSMVVPGHSVIFNVTVEAIPSHAHTYQWKKNKTDIPDATSGSLTIFSVEKADEGIYFCVVSNAAGPVTSHPAELTVLALPTIKTQPTNRSKVVPGSSTTFTVSVKAIPGHDHTYQWQKNKTNIVGATSISLTISSVAKSDEGIYHCVVSNAAGPVMSDPAWLTVLDLPFYARIPAEYILALELIAFSIWCTLFIQRFFR